MSDLASLSRAWVKSPAYRDMTSRQLAIFGIICDEKGPHRVRDLARALRVSKPVVTRAINSLTGLVKRVSDPDDGRSCYVIATGPGRALSDAMKALGNG